jgi:DNA-binding NarL/FixJ family response regulator
MGSMTFTMNLSTQHSLLIIDDHPVYREALCEMLSRELGSFNIEVMTASNANEGIDVVNQSNTSWVILLDVLMLGLSGLAGIKVFKNMPNVAHVVSISGLDAHIWEPKATAAGATLFLSKNSTSMSILGKIKPLFHSEGTAQSSFSAKEVHEFRLSQRQLEVLQLISLGHPNKIIADYLDIKEQTVKIHINQIFKELRVFNRTQAVLKAQKHHLLSAEKLNLK